MSAQTKVAVFGGGLAGMVATLKLVQRGFDVTLYESLARFGGKAGSDDVALTYDASFNLTTPSRLPSGVRSDHGYHIFPAWYVNMKALWAEIDLLPERDCYLGEGPKNLSVHQGKYVFSNDEKPSLRSKFTVFDLITRSDNEVENQTLKGFILSRSYNSLGSVSFSRLLLNALTIQEYDVSARTLRNVFAIWTPVIKKPNWLALKGSLGAVLIDRIEREIIRAAANSKGQVTFQKKTKVDKLAIKEGRLEVHIENSPIPIAGHPIVLALPQEVLRKMNTDTLFEAEPAFSKMQFLRSNTFAALDIYFDQRIKDIPREHFRLLDSEYALTAFDISQHWPELEKVYPDRTVLQFVAGKSASLNTLSTAGFLQALFKEIEKYIPEVKQHVAFYIPHQNIDVPLFVNDVGVWPYRPETNSRIKDVYFAGDYSQTTADVASMEGAVRSGLSAAEAIRARHAPNTPAIKEAPSPSLSKILLYFVRTFITPLRLIAWLIWRLPEHLRLVKRSK